MANHQDVEDFELAARITARTDALIREFQPHTRYADRQEFMRRNDMTDADVKAFEADHPDYAAMLALGDAFRKAVTDRLKQEFTLEEYERACRFEERTGSDARELTDAEWNVQQEAIAAGARKLAALMEKRGAATMGDLIDMWQAEAAQHPDKKYGVNTETGELVEVSNDNNEDDDEDAVLV